MFFSYNWLQDYIKEKLPKPEKLAELLAEHFFPVEEIRKKDRDFALDIDVKQNRAGDCFSHIGIARECAALTSSKFKVQSSKLIEDKNLKAKNFVKVEIKDKNVCQRYTARVITDVKVGPSPKWVKQRLETCGLQAINNIVDIANYVMLETGQPLHAFDFDKISGMKLKVKSQKSKVIKKIIVRFAKKGEKLVTLDNKKYELDGNVLVIADIKKPIGIAGIKGELTTGIDKNTKTVVLESANFNPKVIRKGSKTLNLKTDASLRFEHGIDPNLTETAINRAAQLIQELAKGKIAQGIIDFYPKKVKPQKIRLEIDHVEKLLGIKIPLKEIKNILESLEFKCNESRSRYIEVEIPTFRLDVFLPEDLIEEIGRIHGYKKIPAVLPIACIIPPESNLEIFWEEFSKDALKESGFTEVYNYSFVSDKDREIFGYKTQELAEIENPISAEYQYLCPSLIPNLLKNVKNNFRYFDEIRIFELGKTFHVNSNLKTQNSKPQLKTQNQQNLVEKRSLTGVVASKENQELFYELKGIIDSLLEKMGIANFYYDEYQPTPAASNEASLAQKGREQSRISIWNMGKCAEIKIDNQEIGFLGEISSKILEELKIKAKIVLFDIDFEKLQKLASEEHEFRPISSYPSAVRDLAILVPYDVKVVDALNIIERAGGKLVTDVDLFDIYEGEELPDAKKNLAFHIIYQAEDRTLTAQEIDNVHKKIVKALEENLEWEVRK